MRILRAEDGAALVTALMLTMLSLVMAMTLLYSVTMGTRISASQKRYRSALAAAHGGVELLTSEIFQKLFSQTEQASLTAAFKSSIDLNLPDGVCLQQKLNNPTTNWGASCKPEQFTSDPAQAPDLTFTLDGVPSQPSYRVSAKIVDTVPGNSDQGDVAGLDPGSSVAGGGEGSIVHPQHVPGMYNIAVQGVAGDARERATLSVLYAY